jgi:hypothetical protein
VPWMKTDPSRQGVMLIKLGAKPIEFERRKAGIVAWTTCSAKSGVIGEARKAA